MVVKSSKELVVWQKAMDLVEEAYLISQRFPREEVYGLTAQLRRAAVSVPANIAEGNARATRKDYASFLAVARGSLAEVETLLLVAMRLRYATEDDLRAALELVGEVGRMLNKLRSNLLKSAQH